jgi:23S rRNA pseudoU1915 N3-methylase RlmH
MIRILSVGKVKDAWLREGIQEYRRRIQPYEAIEIVEVRDEKAPETNSDAENEAVLSGLTDREREAAVRAAALVYAAAEGKETP